jgi:hypoxanthine phosphoribosyltransferase
MDIRIKDKTFRRFIDQATLEARIKALAQEISADYAHKNPLFVGVLNGSFMFVGELLKSIDIPSEITFVRVSSYVSTESSGKVKQVLGLNESLENRHVVILEDIIDTGITMSEILPQFLAQNPASVALATMLFKPKALQKDLDVKYVGLEIEPLFVVGYGLDYDGQGRNLPEIYVLA